MLEGIEHILRLPIVVIIAVHLLLFKLRDFAVGGVPVDHATTLLGDVRLAELTLLADRFVQEGVVDFVLVGLTFHLFIFKQEPTSCFIELEDLRVQRLEYLCVLLDHEGAVLSVVNLVARLVLLGDGLVLEASDVLRIGVCVVSLLLIPQLRLQGLLDLTLSEGGLCVVEVLDVLVEHDYVSLGNGCSDVQSGDLDVPVQHLHYYHIVQS